MVPQKSQRNSSHESIPQTIKKTLKTTGYDHNESKSELNEPCILYAVNIMTYFIHDPGSCHLRQQISVAIPKLPKTTCVAPEDPG